MLDPSNDPSSPIRPPLEASQARRVFHTLIAIAGWALFVYWWWLVFHRVSRHEVRFTILFVSFSLVVIVLTTAVWANHNLRIYRRKGPRTKVPYALPDFSHDRVGRPVAFDGGDLRSAPIVVVRTGPEGKHYEGIHTLPPRAGAA